MSNATIFSAGIPTAPDVDRLMEKIGVPEVGKTISYELISSVLKVERGDSRFHSVVSAWRKRLDTKHNIVLKAVPNVGFEALNSSQRVTLSTSEFKGGLRRIRRSASVAARTDSAGLKPEELRVRDHIVRVGGMLQLTAATAARDLRKPETQQQLKSA